MRRTDRSFLPNLIQTTMLQLHRAGGRGRASHLPATEGSYRRMGGVRTDGTGFPEPEGIGRVDRTRRCNTLNDVYISGADWRIHGRDPVRSIPVDVE